ncbi:hypothetical protein RhiirA5_360936 [Rhizophagus irregularis]|uniref:MIR domain-containing protein n=2 Tax=Rhizophagus irregularis TaxID=588596 RepID=A0A2I1EG42_9GLOM|nr:hypothetical protein RhiirA5_367341 [Rhizophagus irregularis]PKC05805.1 hypothetical protein RhiirA5_360936 [Rhizophagus irregularis]PKY21070.1 hypothetical protein RhiirB3_409039 [Rhizophagus irregularis]
MMIDSTIHVPKDVTSLTELVSALKAEVSFTVFKNTSKRKLQVLKYKSENIGGDTSKFIETFRKLCRDAEIDDLKEQKEYFVETLPYTLRKKFLDIIDDIESLSDLILRFNKLLIGPALSTNIKNGSVVALKHVSTGKYLSTIENLRYETGSKSQMVYLGGSELDRSSLWIIKFDKDFATTDTYINLQQRFGKFDKFLGMRYYYEYSARKYYYSSPSNHLEVSCNIMKKNYSDNNWRFDFCDLNNQGYLKPNDIITLSTKNEILNDRYEYLRGHDYQVTIGGEIYYEVICHDKVIGANDNV